MTIEQRLEATAKLTQQNAEQIQQLGGLIARLIALAERTDKRTSLILDAIESHERRIKRLEHGGGKVQ